MASSEAGTSSESEYQVFLNFRGSDIRQGFADILYHNLTDVGIRVFLDDKGLRVGERIDRSLLQAINNSMIYIPIFSRKYASSHWCLLELAQIVANTSKPEGNKEILPIFFDVEPDDVKLKTQLYNDAINKLKCNKKLSNKQVNTWREALMEVDAIKGWEVKKYKSHGKLIKLVVEVVLEKLKIKHRFVTEHLMGIDDRVVVVSKLLDVNSGGVRLIQIHGMGGIGKTTLAKVVFNKLSSHFGKCCCFLEDVRDKSSRIDGLVELQKKLLYEIGVHAGTRSIDEIDYGMKRTGEALSNKKVLIVLDDVDKSEQVEKLVGKSTLYPGSRILITTRNKDVLPINTPNYNVSHYEMEVMSIDCALELFRRHAPAFNRDSPSNDYNDLSRKIVSTTGGLPLALEVIGLFLRHKTRELWIETLEKLSKAPNENVFEKLKISYDALTYEQQQIFLDIACFFVGEDKTNAFYMWKDCEFFPIGGVAVLINKSLVKIVDNKFWMHDQLRDLGRQIIHLEDQMNPERRSRIWICQEVLHAIRTKGNKDVGALYLDIDPLSFQSVVVKSKQIRRFKLLRFLSLTGGTFAGKLECHLTQLRWISWNYPRKIHRSTSMSLTNLVVLEFSGVDFLCSSRLQKIIKMSRKLKVLYLKSCHEITEAPDFSGWPDLERLTFIRCSKLKKIDGSIGKLKCLIDLKIDMCFGLEDLPEEIGDLVNLEHFFVCNCKVKKFPITIWQVKSIREFHFSGCDN